MEKEQIDKVEKVKPFIDYLVDRLISRKFIVFLVATWLVRDGKINGTEWSLFAGLYVSLLVFQKLLDLFVKKQEQSFRHYGSKKHDKPIDVKKIPEVD